MISYNPYFRTYTCICCLCHTLGGRVMPICYLCTARGYGCIRLSILHAFISDLATPRAEATPSPETASVQQRNSMLRHFIDCLVQEYEAARFSDSVSSYRMRHLLLPHMEAHLQVGGLYSGGWSLPRYCLWQPIGVK